MKLHMNESFVRDAVAMILFSVFVYFGWKFGLELFT
jgi:hypothetical protein